MDHFRSRADYMVYARPLGDQIYFDSHTHLRLYHVYSLIPKGQQGTTLHLEMLIYIGKVSVKKTCGLVIYKDLHCQRHLLYNVSG